MEKKQTKKTFLFQHIRRSLISKVYREKLDMATEGLAMALSRFHKCENSSLLHHTGGPHNVLSPFISSCLWLYCA